MGDPKKQPCQQAHMPCNQEDEMPWCAWSKMTPCLARITEHGVWGDEARVDRWHSRRQLLETNVSVSPLLQGLVLHFSLDARLANTWTSFVGNPATDVSSVTLTCKSCCNRSTAV